MFALQTHIPRNSQDEKKSRESVKISSLTSSPLNIDRGNESEEEKDSLRNNRQNSIKVNDNEERK